jgi:tripartite-type tricarboxylate transporter receptor subunit TctC
MRNRGQAQALTDLLGGQVQVDFSTMPPAIEYVKAAKLRALAVTSPGRPWRGLEAGAVAAPLVMKAIEGAGDGL